MRRRRQVDMRSSSLGGLLGGMLLAAAHMLSPSVIEAQTTTRVMIRVVAHDQVLAMDAEPANFGIYERPFNDLGRGQSSD